MSGSGVTTAPFDFDIFLRSGSSTQPEMAASDQGSTPNSSSDRTTVEKSQVRMISWACGRRSIGKTLANRSGSSSQPPAICGVSDEVAQVSITSGSPTNPPGMPRLVGGEPVGHVRRGVDGEVALVGHDRGVEVDLAVRAHRVPDRERDPVEPLAADVPVRVEPLHPGPVAVGHVRRVPAELLPSGEQPVA